MFLRKRLLGILPLFVIPFAISFLNAQIQEVKAAGAVDDRTITKCYDPGIYTAGDFCINEKIASLQQLERLAEQTEKPANIIMHINAKGAVITESGSSLGLSFKTASTYFEDKMIPVFYVKDSETVDNFYTYWSSTWKRHDISFISDSSEILKYARDTITCARGILDYSKKTIDDIKLGDLVKESTLSKANTILLSSEQASKENITYLQARFKTVWIDESKASDLEIAEDIIHGAYGVVVKDTRKVISYLKQFNDSVYSDLNQNRAPYNVAHRGLPGDMWENSLEGCIKAVEGGATHIEIDLQLTKDEKAIIMHDDTIDRTTNGTGKVSSLTADELKEFKITKTMAGIKKEPGVAIPTLGDIFDYFKGKDTVIIVELKTNNTKCIDILKECIEKYDIAGQILVISFYSSHLKLMNQKIGYIPCADLNNFNDSSLSSGSLSTFNQYNYVIDCNQSCFSSSLTRELANRGFAAWMWTYDNLQQCYVGDARGIVGLTNNAANSFGKSPTSIITELSYTVDDIDNMSVEVGLCDYVGVRDETSLTATPLFKEKIDDNTYKVILQSKFDTGKGSPRLKATLFSDIVTVHIEKSEPVSSSIPPSSSMLTSSISSSEVPVSSTISSTPTSSSGGGCGGNINSLSIAVPIVCCLTICIATILSIKYRKVNK